MQFSNSKLKESRPVSRFVHIPMECLHRRMSYYEDKTCYICYFYVKHIYLQLNLRDMFIHLVFIVPYKDLFFGYVGFVPQEDGDPVM